MSHLPPDGPRPAAETATNTAAEPASVEAELAAMRRIITALSKLDRRSSVRVVSWLADRYAVDLSAVLDRYDEFREARR